MIEIFKNKKIILGVTASIAAYKAPSLVRDIIKAGAHVNVVMTPTAKEFVAAAALASVSKNPVVTEMFDPSLQTGGAWHIELSHWADVMIIAPCSATTLSKLANGNCDNALSCVAVALPREIPLIIAPAMDYTMWMHPAVQRNAELLRSYGAILIPPAEGELASGLIGPGRLPDNDILIAALENVFLGKNVVDEKKNITDKLNKSIEKPIETLDQSIDKDKWNAELELELLKKKAASGFSLNNKKVLITAGPTREKIDDVRFIANHSTGKMGYALADIVAEMGAKVCLVSGPVNISTQNKSIEIINVESAEEMYNETVSRFEKYDIAILSAAVADFTPEFPKEGKIKKNDLTNDGLSISLKKTKDILAFLGSIKTDNQLLIGFALESANEIEYGKEKLEKKNCDMIVVNSANKPDSGFGGDYNTISILTKSGLVNHYEAMPKTDCAKKILIEAIKMIKK